MSRLFPVRRARCAWLSHGLILNLIWAASLMAAGQPARPPASGPKGQPAPPPAGPKPPTPKPQPVPPPPPPNFGDPLPGLAGDELAAFRSGQALFREVESIRDGIGPVFNGSSCAACHAEPAVGGGSAILSTRFATISNGRFDPLIRLGGPVLQTTGIRGLQGVAIPGEVVPRAATIVAHRRSPPTFGLGLVDAVPDTVFVALAAHQAMFSPQTAGRVNRVMDLRTGRRVVGKFGWKAASPNLLNFSGDAYKEEMGITTPGWLPDADGRRIDEENPPQGDARWLAFNPVESPNDADIDDVAAFAEFMSLLAPPPRGPITAQVTAGEKVFQRISCSNCHVSTLITGPLASPALRLKTFSPYSDFLLHDMGSLGDGIEQGIALGSEMRTTPLWGLRKQTMFLHDGRARTIEEAILQHRGQGQASSDQFRGLTPADRADLLAFLKSL